VLDEGIHDKSPARDSGNQGSPRSPAVGRFEDLPVAGAEKNRLRIAGVDQESTDVSAERTDAFERDSGLVRIRGC
jgi:hypothetical protein